MKCIIGALILTLFCASFAQAEDFKVLPAPNVGDVTFTHDRHVARLKTCTLCHRDDNGGKIEELSMQTDAHKFCVTCHETRKVGPTKCWQCHNKQR